MTSAQKQAVQDAIQAEIDQLVSMLIASPGQTTPGRTGVKVLTLIRQREDALATLEALPLVQ